MRVGFVVQDASGWHGGVNYYRNLFSALRDAPEAGVESYVFHPPHVEIPVGQVSRDVPLRILREGSVPCRFRYVVKNIVRSDLLLERRLLAEGVELISHSDVGNPRHLPAINWIPDVQHRRLPEFFQPGELAFRDRTFALAIREATLVIASSDTARRDIEELFPEAAGRVRVLRFVVAPEAPSSEAPAGVPERHQLPGRFLLLPNQFWAHKNHGVVVDALAILRSRGERVTIVCTGNTHDYRQPDYFTRLQARMREAGVDEQMPILGMVPYADLAWMMRNAVALVNPSLFEGWSTSVEEAKSLGKKVVLSDIPVHREQAPERGAYFDPRDPEALADALASAWRDHDPAEDLACAERARAALPGRRREFALTYAAIAREAIALGRRRG